MTERKKFFNNPITVRFSNDEYTLREEQFCEMFPDLDPEGITNRVVFNALFDRAFGKFEKSNVPRKEDQDTIQNLTNEIGRLKIEIDLKKEAMEGSDILCALKNEELERLKTHLSNEPAAPVLTKDQLIISIPPIIAKVLEIEAVTAKRKTGKDFTIGEILTNSFWESVTVGRVYPWKAWDRSDLSKLANELKAAE